MQLEKDSHIRTNQHLSPTLPLHPSWIFSQTNREKWRGAERSQTSCGNSFQHKTILHARHGGDCFMLCFSSKCVCSLLYMWVRAFFMYVCCCYCCCLFAVHLSLQTLQAWCINSRRGTLLLHLHREHMKKYLNVYLREDKSEMQEYLLHE